MILEFDLGNTRYKWRLRDGHSVVSRGSFAAPTSFESIKESINGFENQIKQVWVASVVGQAVEAALTDWCSSNLSISPEFARAASKCLNVINGYADPAQLGVDRWLGIIAGHQRSQCACLIISFGTAITLDLVAKDGAHAGGFIAPGLTLMLDSLQQKTHKVAPDRDENAFNLAPGRSTSAAVYGALTAMLNGLVENGLSQMHQLAPGEEVKLIFAGGDAQKFLALYPQAQYVPDLVFDGLGHVFNNSTCTE